MRASAPALVLNAGQKSELEGLVRNGSTPQKVAVRCRLLLLAHEGVANQSIAEQLSLSRPTVLAFRGAFEKNGVTAVTGIRRRKRAGSVLTPQLEQKIVDTTVKTRPGDGGTHWTVRMLAAQLRVSRTIVHRVWQRHDIQPHRVERFKLSNDPHFEEKVRDIVGLYLNPPERALVLCVDEKSQIQALDRTAPILPLRPGLPERQTHDYKRHGTTTLFAAFNILNGKVIGTCQDRHRSREFIRFLNHLETQIPADQEVHLIMDNYCTHKSEEVQRWLRPKKRKRFHFHFTPTSSSWLNQVERFFALITGRMIRRGTFHSTDELEMAIYKWLATWNGKSTPFVWKASADVILDKVRRCKELSKTGD
jgi:transposase/DNA-binding CsgD family transcriptional regulator